MQEKERAKQRAKELVSQMTVEEMASQLRYDAPAIERLGIPAYNWWNEGLHGVARAGTATVFPQAIGLAATFDTQLIHRTADIIATEARAKYNAAVKEGDRDIYKGLTLWSPNINIFRDPRWGRGHETYGEDPFLTAALGVAFVKGLQGDGEYLKCAACAKHFAVHSGPEALRHEFDAQASEKDMEETYLPAFKELVTKAGVEGVMGAYNRVNGEPACASPSLQKRLRGEWKFDGYFVSDCWAIRDFHEHHMVTKTAPESAALAIKNGCDLNCGNTYLHLLTALREGLIEEADIRQAAERVMTTRFRLGLFDRTEYDNIPYSVVACEEHREAALQAARESMVLLKNNGILPLKASEKVAVIGPNADSRDVLLGNYNGTPKKYTTVLEGIYERVGMERVLYSQGCHLYKEKVENLAMVQDRLSEAVTTAKESDVVILCLGLDAGLEGEEGDAGNAYASGDKADLELPAAQRKLLDAILAVGKPVIVVSMTGSAINLSRAQKSADAVIQAWYPGGEGGRAVAELIYGDYSPSGKLPVTFYAKTDDLPPFTDYSMKNRTYRYFQGTPLYPFGFGLSYTTFTYEACIREHCLYVKVANTGNMDSGEVVQVYAENRLCGFTRIFIPAGTVQTTSFPLEEMNLKTEKRLLVGGIGYQPEKLLSISLY
ncbi:glycoside hydrolase family 3 C-terminal domain-containing protein [Ructibacterium gallinarum]|uniref:Glycoside hydrolase family 3 C-terminal domain-containing protein n=1 Tax=Ructibacterium gallinarum TaxID=2779355 RepID=A0A9D5M646_9FIRM|nr:glycoside hydrolase family 3 C-terminal domain-containing protein [Ructibacterium gallinarum]MBE5040264.1 glycoside hydrolase family 3 C-terminal domain-containing protein [Ructibacterium gallinarum]